MSDRLTDRLVSPPTRASARKRAYPDAETNAETYTESDRSEARPSVHGYTVEQVAEALNIGRDKVYELLRTEQLRSIKIGKLRRITDQHLAEFIAKLEDIDRKDRSSQDFPGRPMMTYRMVATGPDRNPAWRRGSGPAREEPPWQEEGSR
jgi:excisionase family DNA binding protein